MSATGPPSAAEARAEQRRLAAMVHRGPARPVPDLICGVDVSYRPGSDDAVAVAAVIASATLELVEWASAAGSTSFPYVPGLLSFREQPLALAAIERLDSTPGAVVADGHGYAHPERFGLACHLGVTTGLPTIGCAKTMFVGRHDPLDREAGSWADIVDDGEVVGQAVRTRTGVKPVYVSVGHSIDLDSARDVVLALCRRYRLPETTRQADRLSRQLLSRHPQPSPPPD